MKDDQGELFPNLPGYVRGSDTSKGAADSMEDAAPFLRGKVLAHIRMSGSRGATDDELEVALGLSHQTASARRRELELLGQVMKTMQRRKTRSGRTAGVYVAS